MVVADLALARLESSPDLALAQLLSIFAGAGTTANGLIRIDLKRRMLMKTAEA